jgi:hypothetical protein
MSNGRRQSTGVILIGALLLLVAAALFALPGFLPAESRSPDLPRVIGQVGGGLAGVGAIVLILGLVMRSRAGRAGS